MIKRTSVFRKRKSKEDRGENDDGGDGEKDLSGDWASEVDHDKDFKRMKMKVEELCDEDKILVIFKKLLND
ncbi:hypothetical protein ACS0TY_025124 [Phlomoides rotata]